MKKCSKCKETKDFSEYPKDKYTRDGFKGICKICNRESLKKYHLENIDKVKEKNRRYHLENADKVSQRKREYYSKNSHTLRERTRKFRESHKDGLHHVYYLPEHNYVGTTENLYTRMSFHRDRHGRNTDNYQILASFEDRTKALRFESLLHDSGFEGRHRFNTYQ